jgi:PAP2 superfamily
MVQTLMTLALLCAMLPAWVAGSTAASIDGGGEPSAVIADRPDTQVIPWNRTLLEILRTPGAQPATVHPTRSFAIMHAAIYDAANAIDRTHTPYLVHLPGVSRHASQEAAAATAAHDVLVELYPQFQAMLDTQLQDSLAQLPEGPHKSMGIQIGQIVAERILALRSNDGSDAQPLPFVPGNDPGDYQLTPPNFPQPVFTHWPDVTPFALEDADQFRPSPPPALASDTYTAAFNEVKGLGFIDSATRSPDQTEIAKFWGGAIQNYWNEVTQTAALANNLTLAQSARLFALLDLTLADSVIAFYDAKYTYQFWRPVTAIRAADTDGNPETMADPNWTPLTGTTPPDPSYPGAHAVISAAGAEVLGAFFGSDDFSLTVSSEVLPGVERSFTSFTAAADEATVSRIFAGVHFRSDLTVGQELGRNIADFVVEHFLIPRRHSEREADDR